MGRPERNDVGVVLIREESIVLECQRDSMNGNWERLMVTRPSESDECEKDIPKK